MLGSGDGTPTALFHLLRSNPRPGRNKRRIPAMRKVQKIAEDAQIHSKNETFSSNIHRTQTSKVVLFPVPTINVVFLAGVAES